MNLWEGLTSVVKKCWARVEIKDWEDEISIKKAQHTHINYLKQLKRSQ